MIVCRFVFGRRFSRRSDQPGQLPHGKIFPAIVAGSPAASGGYCLASSRAICLSHFALPPSWVLGCTSDSSAKATTTSPLHKGEAYRMGNRQDCAASALASQVL